MIPITSVFKNTIAKLIKDDEILSTMSNGRVFINRYDPWEERQHASIGIYATSEEPVESNLSREPDMRKFNFHVETVLYVGVKQLEQKLDLIAEQLERVLLVPGALDSLGEALIAAGYLDTLENIIWEGTDSAYISEGDEGLGVKIIQFSIKYEKAEPPLDLDAFLEAATDWESEGLSPSNVVEFEE
jgi:hypothetical protein